MQVADAGFEPAEARGSFALANIVAAQIVRAILDGAGTDGKARRRADVRGNEAGTKDDAIGFEQASPQIGQVDSVERAAGGEADGLELGGGKRGGGQGKGEFRHGSGAQTGQFQGEGVGGEQHLAGANFFLVDATPEFVADAQAERIGEIQRANLGVLGDLSAGFFRGARQAGEDFAGVNRAAGHAADDFQLAEVAPGNG